MRVRWSQLVYRRPGSDNEVGLARVCKTLNGETMHFQDARPQIGDESKGYLALVPLARGFEEELDEWIEIDPEVFLERQRSLWEDSHAPEPTQVFVRSWLNAVTEFLNLQTSRA
ncbi:MAG: hypothetical protein CL920_20545 [Deltaproteobacteria bacterium]|nr:hypothetical protein [Deltaproteobacteria bacterium]MBU51083.1 hypothetical protein [Deltaproteobacteria bacterium]